MIPFPDDEGGAPRYGGKIEVLTRFADFDRSQELVLVVRHFDGSMSVAQPLRFTKLNPVEVIRAPTAHSNYANKFVSELLQAMLDHAWEQGLRPKGFADTTEQVKALREHRDDLRRLVFHKEGIAV